MEATEAVERKYDDGLTVIGEVSRYAVESKAAAEVRMPTVNAKGSSSVNSRRRNRSAVNGTYSSNDSTGFDGKKTIRKENKIFISWSGENSKEIAKELKTAFEEEIFENDGVECFVSDLDIASGEDWWSKIKDELRICKAGIICITKENLDASWLYFEAGALIANEVPTIPLLVYCSPMVLSNTPFSNKQAIEFCKEDRFIKMVTDVRRILGLKAPGKNQWPVVVKNAYYNMLERLENVLKQLKSTSAFSRKYIYPAGVDTVVHNTIYISVPMSSIEEGEYEELRKNINKLKPLLKEIGFKQVTCPMFDIDSKERFDGNTKAIKDNFPILKQVDCMLVIYPRQVPSSTLVEIGYGLALCKKMVIFHKVELPYILMEAGETITHIRTYQYDTFNKIEDTIRKNQMTLFEGGL